MTTSYPNSKQTFTDPTSSNTLNSPSHSGLHTDMNDTVEAIEDKIGTGASTPTNGKVLTGTGTGTSAWSDPPATVTKATSAELNAGTDDAKFATAAAIAGSFLGVQGGWSPLGAATYEASDDPTYTLSFASDMTGILSAGMRMKLTDSGTQYFIITAVGAYSGGKTIITVYGGTDYNLSGGAITSPYYSVQKAPFGFPLDPAKWTAILSNTSNATTATPTANTWYNVSPLSLSVPIGAWNLGYQATLNVDDTSVTSVTVFSTLSTANNSASDDELTTFNRLEGASGNLTFTLNVNRSKYVTLASKTTYYLNHKTSATGIANIGFRGDANLGNTIIRAVCAYL